MSRYIVVGVWNSIFGITFFYLLSIYFSRTFDLIILGSSYFISTVQAHFAQRNFVWKSHAAYLPELIKFSFVYIIQFVLNAFLLLLTNHFLSFPREINQTFIVIFLTIIFYFVNKNGVFHEK
jgi:putative flippase GtrA